jgi:hypothetical protein
MRAGCNAQRVIVPRPVQARRSGTSTERLKTGAEDLMTKRHVGRAEFFAPPSFGMCLTPFSGCATTGNGAIEYQ